MAASAQHEPESHFSVFVRLPFPRGDFVDPPLVAWSASKERALWNVISRPSKGNDTDWKALADEFDVSQPFLLQQAALLYERQLSQVRAQMRKVGTAASASPSPAPPESASNSALGAGSQPMKRGNSGGSRVSSRLSTRLKDSTTLKNEGSSPGTPSKTRAHPMSRTTSNNTPTHNRQSSIGMRPKSTSVRSSRSPSRETLTSRAPGKKDDRANIPSPVPAQEDSESSASSSSDSEPEPSAPRRGPGAKRYQRYSSRPSVNPVGEDEDDEDSPTFLPFATSADSKSKQSTGQDPSATLRAMNERPTAQRRPTTERVSQAQQAISESASSESSGVAAPAVPKGPSSKAVRPPGPLSPRRAAELAGLSPRRRPAGKDGSDGTPSMGSSFSDLDDTSVTQSALEEALLSNMQQGNMQSRMSSISQALRSRYL